MTTTQAVILAAGLGTRMKKDDGTALDAAHRAAAETGSKAMMPVGPNGERLIDYLFSSLTVAGITDVTLVIAPSNEAIMAHVEQSIAPLNFRFAAQMEPKGTADAVRSAKGKVRDEPFLVLNSDNLYSVSALRAATRLKGNGLVAYEAGALVSRSGYDRDRILHFALLDIAPDDTLRAIVEKPAADHPLAVAAERWVSMNLWSFTPEVFEACDRVEPSARGELEIQGAVTVMMRDMGLTFHVARSHSAVYDLSSRADIANVVARLAGEKGG